MNNNSFLHHKWMDSTTPCSIPAQQQGTGGREAPLKSPWWAFKFQKISKFHWMTKSCKIPVEDTLILTLSLSAEGSVSCLHYKWLKP